MKPVGAMSSAVSGGALPDAPAPQGMGSISGTVRGATGMPMAGAQVTLSGENAVHRTAVADASGHFQFTGLGAGNYTVTVTAAGTEPHAPINVPLGKGEQYKLPIRLRPLPRVTSTVHVTATTAQVATAQVKQQEQQRVLSVFPNFYASYVWNAAPMTKPLKYRLAFRTVIDPITFATDALVAGGEQWHDTFPGYGSGIQGYAKRFGATYADTVIGRFVGNAILASAFHQDPRYFYDPRGSNSSRLLYALKESVMCRGDDGRQQVAWAHLLGIVIAAGASNAYRAPGDRSVSITFRDAGVNMAADALDNVVRQFLPRQWISHAPRHEGQQP